MKSAFSLLLLAFLSTNVYAQTPQIDGVKIGDYGLYTVNKQGAESAQNVPGGSRNLVEDIRHAATTRTIPAQKGWCSDLTLQLSARLRAPLCHFTSLMFTHLPVYAILPLKNYPAVRNMIELRPSGLQRSQATALIRIGSLCRAFGQFKSGTKVAS
jgi:hypothetical protein